MTYGFSSGNARVKTLAGAIFFAVAGMAHAGTTLVGGGATLPSLGYVGIAAASSKQVTSASANSLFGVYSAQRGAVPISYCLTGSGTGKKIFTAVTGFGVQNACPNTGTITGFGAAAASRTDLMQPNFAASDAPLTQADYSNYIKNVAGSTPVEFPALAGAIAIAFNKADDQGTAVSNVNLTDAQICKVFSGQIVNWNDTNLTSAFTLPSGHTVSGPISVNFRSDGSGTTFGLSNHFSSVCGGGTPSVHFVTDPTFTVVVGQYLPTIPGNWVGSKGNAAVITAIQSANGSMGYVEAANAIDSGVAFARVNGLSPQASLGSPSTHQVTVTNSTDVLYNQVINGADPSTGIAVVQAISPAPATQCVALVKPSSYAIQGRGFYPIVAISYLLGNSNNNGADLAAVKGLLSAPYNASITGNKSITTIGANTGLAFLTSGFTTTQVAACLVN